MRPPAAAIEAFDRAARTFEASRRRLVPGYDMIYGAAIELIRERRPVGSPLVLDLGAGTGLFAALAAEAMPDARLTLVDGSEAMLSEARLRFRDRDGVRFLVADLATDAIGGAWDLIISSLAIHHLEDDAKRRLFRDVRSSLVPGGTFVNVEQIRGADAAAEELYGRMWLRQAAEGGASADEIAAAQGRMTFDRCASLDDNLRWLREAGLREVDCVAKSWRFAVLTGRR